MFHSPIAVSTARQDLYSYFFTYESAYSVSPEDTSKTVNIFVQYKYYFPTTKIKKYSHSFKMKTNEKLDKFVI